MYGVEKQKYFEERSATYCRRHVHDRACNHSEVQGTSDRSPSWRKAALDVKAGMTQSLSFPFQSFCVMPELFAMCYARPFKGKTSQHRDLLRHSRGPEAFLHHHGGWKSVDERAESG